MLDRNFTYYKEKYGTGAREKFEDACHTILSTKYSSEEVKAVKVTQGDGGIDIFIGRYGLEPLIIYQCKYFPNTIGDSQKNQVRESFKVAIKSEGYELKEWVLCVAVDSFDRNEHRWWSQWKTKQENNYPNIKIRLQTGKHLVDESRKQGTYIQLFDIEDSKRLKRIETSLWGVNQKLNDLNYIREKLPSYLNIVVLDLHRKLDYTKRKPPKSPGDIHRKISHNQLKKYKETVIKYGEYGFVIDKIYNSLNANRPRGVSRFLNSINNKYLVIKGDLTARFPDLEPMQVIQKQADYIIEYVLDDLERDYLNSYTQDEVMQEDLEICLLVIVVDAFIRCEILEKPPENDTN